MTTNNEIQPYDQYDNSFIDKLLGEMKNKFNKLDSTNGSAPNNEELKDNKSKNPKESVEVNKRKVESVQPVLTLGQPTSESPGRRSYRHKTTPPEEKNDESLKRSSRRSNVTKKSVLQNAIARKVKSYNEPNRPQRLTRQLKPTQKVLENIAQAKDVKRVKMKTTDSNNSEFTEGNGNTKKSSTIVRKNTKNIKKLKTSDSDNETESDETCYEDSLELNAVIVMKNVKKSKKISTGLSKDVCDLSLRPKPEIVDQVEDIPGHSSTSLMSENPELASRLCLCTQKTNFYPVANSDDVVYCSAVDSIDERLVGCSREVNVMVSPLLRPSRRVPYLSLCELHKNRMIRHNCCPNCGVFCTQGKFAQCEAKHQFHQKCRLSVDNTECCPHCGVSTPSRDILLKFQCSNSPVFLPIQKSKCQTAKMAFSKAKDQIRCSTPLLIPIDSFQNFENTLTNGTTFGENDILDAIRDGDEERLASIITSNSLDVHFRLGDFNEGTLLHYAAYNGMLKICHLLVSLGFQINEIDKELNTPLMLAITAHKMEVVQYLVRAGANIALKGTDGMTALHVSSKCGNLQACKILLEAGASIKKYIDSQDDGGWTPLVWACENGFSEITDFLISQGADHRLRDVEYNEALHWAGFSGCSHIVELLLNRGCDVNTANAHGETPLHIAAREDRYNCVIVLLARGADVFLKNKNNETPLNCVPEDGMCYNPIVLNIQLQSIVNPASRQYRTIVSEDISKGKESNPVQCINTVDDDLDPVDYVYITKSLFSSDVILDTKPSSLQRCKCEERCTGEDCLCGKLSVKCWYDEDGKVAVDFSFSDTPIIFECSDTCSCNAITCRNRVVQRGTQQRFQLYKTDSKGWGIKTLRCIVKGHFVCEYVGEILTDVDADYREDDSFLFDLGNKELEHFCIDAKLYGNLTRFINHSCNPNLHPIKVFVDHQDLRFPRVAFFALKDISIGDELSFDYGQKFWMAKYKSFTCQCGFEDCKYSEEAIGRIVSDTDHLDDTDDSSSS